MWILSDQLSLAFSFILAISILVYLVRSDPSSRRAFSFGVPSMGVIMLAAALNWSVLSDSGVRYADARVKEQAPVSQTEKEDPALDPVEEGPDEPQVEDPSIGPATNSGPVDGGVRDPIEPIECSDPKHCVDPRIKAKD